MIPQNAAYYHAAYLVVIVVHAAYALSIWQRRRTVRRRLADANDSGPRA